MLSACLGDVIIFLLFMVQRRRVVEREEWTPEMKQKQAPNPRQAWMCIPTSTLCREEKGDLLIKGHQGPFRDP